MKRLLISLVLLAVWSSGGAPNPMPIHVARLANDGNYLWPGSIIDISTEANSVGRLNGGISSDGYAAFAWTAAAASLTGDIHAQNINLDGSLGDASMIFRNSFE